MLPMIKKQENSKAKSYEGGLMLLLILKIFTRLAKILSPEELVDKIEFNCFTENFDENHFKYQLKKSKTMRFLPLRFRFHNFMKKV